MTKWRLIDHPAMEPALNMAIDEAILKAHAGGETPPTLRLYTWDPPALSLGRFQRDPGVNGDAMKRLGIVAVRRTTGGRAVLHLGDLTYSVVTTAGRDTPYSLEASYRYLCRGLVEAFTLLGVEVDFGLEKTGRNTATSCFATAAAGDITWQGKKFVGNAQKRLGNCLLQHGSILLTPQEKELQELFQGQDPVILAKLRRNVTSLNSILGRNITLDEIKSVMVEGFSEGLGIKLIKGELTSAEANQAGQFRIRFNS